ncbi:MAG: bifunctional (p)ppGpp synthetase/guanosine-3',5'-bis(diphosphate) 3'-pyrophosphohydrolase [Nitrospirota bacterium]|nr:bifunctional (p)ppGpp synthetase/guanosine-3',5'-bis(diphosphate) 3'-pyrophosphohydrolase [Nitrospirota bacterium]
MNDTVTDFGLIDRVIAYRPEANVELIQRALRLSAEAHAGQRRASGVPYLKHPVEVAEILTQLRMDESTVVAALLHDTLEDTHFTREQIAAEFGEEIAWLVDGVTKIDKLRLVSREEAQAENFRKMLLSMARDIRVIIIKLADRLHNMRTLTPLSDEKRQRIATETQEIYAPIANRLGLGWIKVELEDLCLRYLKPELYFSLVKQVAAGKKVRDRYLDEVREIVEREIERVNIPAEVAGRSKHIYSIYQKMSDQNLELEQLYDLSGIRIITDTKMHCYALLGIIHSLWQPIPGKFKDYVALPKSNGYQSLHTTVVCERGNRVEFQIRTRDMHRVAEEGIAAHWKYKEGGPIDPSGDDAFRWLRQILEWQQQISDGKQFLDALKVDLFSDSVFPYTRNGELLEMPRGSTVLDFAFAIHTELGLGCVGASVDGKLVSPRHVLKSGQTVEILTSEDQRPVREWIGFLKTARARSAVKHWLKSEERRRTVDVGRKVLAREIRRQGHSPEQVLAGIDKALNALKVADEQALYSEVGYGKRSIGEVLAHLLPDSRVRPSFKERIMMRLGRRDGAVVITGEGVMVHLAGCCRPIPGDPIVGHVKRGRGLVVHVQDCAQLDQFDFDPELMVEVAWDEHPTCPTSVPVQVLTRDRTGILGKVSSAIADAKANISHAQIHTTEDRKASFNLILEVDHVRHLEKVIRAVEKLPDVLEMRRLRGN